MYKVGVTGINGIEEHIAPDETKAFTLASSLVTENCVAAITEDGKYISAVYFTENNKKNVEELLIFTLNIKK